MKHIIATLILLFGISNLNAQQTISLNQLVGTKWKLESEETRREMTWTFSSTEFTRTTTYNFPYPLINPITKEVKPAVYNDCFRYYLSTTSPSQFDKSKVGKSTSGQYLTILSLKNELEYYTIMSLTSDRLTLQKNLTKKDFEDNEVTETYTYTFLRIK